MEKALPEKWRAGTPPLSSLPSPAQAAQPAVATPIPSVPPPAPARMPSVEPQLQQITVPIKFEGFLGTGSDRKAIFSKGREHITLGIGSSIGGYKIKSMAEDELVLQRRSEVNRLIPGQTWEVSR